MTSDIELFYMWQLVLVAADEGHCPTKQLGGLFKWLDY